MNSRRGLAPQENRRIDSWKEIAAFFDRDERTVKRWEKERSLPVHRLPGGSRARVFAFTVELESWMHSLETSGANSPTADDSITTESNSPAADQLDPSVSLEKAQSEPAPPSHTWRL